MSLRSLIGEIDRSLAIVGIIVSVIVIILFGSGQFALEVTFSSSGQIYVVAGVLLLLACTFYLFTRKSLSSSFPNNLKAIYPHNKLRLCLNIVFLALFSFSVLSLLFRPDPYIRPLYYFVALALMVTVVSLEIVFLPFQRRHVALALLKIMLIGLSIEFSELLIFPDLIGIDPYGHRSLTLGLLSSGHVPAGNTYSNMPLMHILIGLTMSVTNLSYKYATMLSISLPQVFINSIITYLLGRRLLNNERIGLLGGLLLAVANWNITMGYWTIPNTLAAIFVLLIVYLLLRFQKIKSHMGILSIMLVMIALITEHALTAVILAIILLVFWLGPKIKKWDHDKKEMPVSPVLLLLFVVGMLSWWFFVSPVHMNIVANQLSQGFNLQQMEPPFSLYASSVPIMEQVFNNIGMFLYFSIAFFGCLYLISKKFGGQSKFLLASSGIVLLGISFSSILFSVWIVAYRWWFLAEILLAVPLGLAFFLISAKIKSRALKSAVLAILIFCLSFTMIISSTSNIDNSTFSANSKVRYALTSSELQALNTTTSFLSGRLGLDNYYYLAIASSNYAIEIIDSQLSSANYSGLQNTLVLIRSEIVSHPYYAKLIALDKLKYDPNQDLDCNGFSRVYDCNSVTGHIKTGE